MFELKPFGFSSLFSKGITESTAINFCAKGNSTSSIPIPLIPLELSKEPQVPLFILEEDIKKYQYHSKSHRDQFR